MNDIKTIVIELKKEGKSEEEIVDYLIKKGYSYEDIGNIFKKEEDDKKQQLNEQTGFFELNHIWKIWVYRFGLFFCCLSLFGLILIGINANQHYGEDILKRKEKPKFNGKLEMFFYLFGCFISILILLVILGELIGVVSNG